MAKKRNKRYQYGQQQVHQPVGALNYDDVCEKIREEVVEVIDTTSPDDEFIESFIGGYLLGVSAVLTKDQYRTVLLDTRKRIKSDMRLDHSLATRVQDILDNEIIR